MPAPRSSPAAGRPAPHAGRGWWEALADLLLGARCAGCDQVPGLWCNRCAASASPEHVGGWWTRPVWAATRYEGPAGRAIVQHKERGRLALAGPLGGLLAEAVTCVPDVRDSVTLVPTPSRPAAVRSRGQDHAARLAAAAVRHLEAAGIDAAVRPVLRLTRTVRDQSGLTAEQRRTNLAGAFVAHVPPGRLATSPVVVVDDIWTTGTTLTSAAQALGDAGVDVAGGAVVAFVGRTIAQPRPHGPAIDASAGLA